MAQDWEALKACENEPEQEDGYITCCTDHLTRFALVPAEYLEIVKQVQQPEKQTPAEPVKEQPEVQAEPEVPNATKTVELADTGRGLNIKYLIGCICALLTLIATVLCLSKQVFALRSEKRRYDQLVKDGKSPTQKNDQPDAVMPTERALITEANDPAKKEEDASPRRVIATDMPALQSCQTEENDTNLDRQMKPKREPSGDFLQIEDQGEAGTALTKKQSKKQKQLLKEATSSISAKQDVNELFDAEPEEMVEPAKQQSSSKKRRNRKAKQAKANEAATAVEKKQKQEKSQTLVVHGDENPAVNSDLAQVFALPDIPSNEKKPPTAKFDSINDLYDVDLTKKDQYSSPSKVPQ